EEILGSSSHVSRVLLTTLAERLTNGSRSRPARQRPPVTIAVVSLDPHAAALGIEPVLEQELRKLARIIRPPRSAATRPDTDPGVALAELLDRIEHFHDHVLLTPENADPSSEWAQACM